MQLANLSSLIFRRNESTEFLTFVSFWLNFLFGDFCHKTKRFSFWFAENHNLGYISKKSNEYLK